MKKNDIALIILIASISALAAWFGASAIIKDPQQSEAKYKSAEAITSDIQKPDATIFNKDAINPTVDRSIGQSSSQLPFDNGEKTDSGE